MAVNREPIFDILCGALAALFVLAVLTILMLAIVWRPLTCGV